MSDPAADEHRPAHDWLETCARLLEQDELTDAEIGEILDVTRVVAHGTERRFAPLSAYLLGAATAGEGADRAAAARRLADRLRAALPPDEDA